VTFQRTTGEEERAAAPAPAPQSGEAADGAEVTTVNRVAALAAPPGRNSAIERLTYGPAAEVWPEGAAPLVRWLRANPEVVGDLLNVTLTGVAEEVPGSDACLFEDPEGRRMLVVVEMGESSEATFGTLMTRLTATRAQAALWVCAAARPEHVAAVSWLNRSVDARFYIARLRAARIGMSAPAPDLDLTVRPARATDAAPDGPTGAPERGRRAEDWREIALGEVSG
jgi:hypothetical protein